MDRRSSTRRTPSSSKREAADAVVVCGGCALGAPPPRSELLGRLLFNPAFFFASALRGPRVVFLSRACPSLFVRFIHSQMCVKTKQKTTSIRPAEISRRAISNNFSVFVFGCFVVHSFAEAMLHFCVDSAAMLCRWWFVAVLARRDCQCAAAPSVPLRCLWPASCVRDPRRAAMVHASAHSSVQAN